MSEEIPLCKRPAKKARLETSDADRISALPDDILTHILSFVSTKEAVRTCVLSKRWRNMWASVPCLRFDIANFVPESQVSIKDRTAYEKRFSNFIRGVLRNREGNLQLDVFALEWSTMGRSKYCTSSLVECVTRALQSMPHVFSLHIFECYDFNLDYDGIFTCASLEEISLVTINEAEHAKYDKVALRICDLPRLKKLRIAYKKLDDYCLETLFRGCPSLEELELCECGLLASKLHSTGLKKLIIRGCLIHAKLDINAPNLEHLTIATSHLMMGGISGNLPSLVDARITFPPANDHDDEFAMLFNSLSNATSLNLSFEHLYAATYAYIEKVHAQVSSVKFPSFKNLRSLVFGDLIDPEIDFIALFMQHSPNLQELTLHRIEGYMEHALQEWPPVSKIVKLSLAGLWLNRPLSTVIGSILQHLPLLEKLVLYPQICQGFSDGQYLPLQVAPFPCRHLKTIEIGFSSFTDDLVRVVKYLHAGIKGKETKLILTNSLK